MKSNVESDKKLITQLGGITALAKLINVTPQRVYNWKNRGIPPSIKLKFPEIFLKQPTDTTQLDTSKAIKHEYQNDDFKQTNPSI